MSTSPAVGSSRPVIIRSSVDLPQPEGPTIAKSSPSSMTSSMSRTAQSPPRYRLFRCRSSSVDIVALAGSDPRQRLAVLELRLEIVGVHRGDRVDRDLLRTCRFALTVVRARSEVLVHLLDHRLGALEALGLPLREQVEMDELGRREQVGRTVRAGRHTGATAD